MAKDYSNRPRRDNAEISKVYQEIVSGEKKIAHRRLKVRALCTHTRSPQVPFMTYKKIHDPKTNTDKTIWVCRICGQEVDLAGMDEQKLIDAINTVTNAVDFIKIMTNGSERDNKLVTDVLAEIHFRINAYLLNAYRSARNTSTKRTNDERRAGGRRTNAVWET